TVEGGWQVYPGKYGTYNTVLFIYWTADGYKNTGCYNLDCAGFVQVNNSVSLGGSFPIYSSIVNGVKYSASFDMTWQLYQGNWWLAYGSTWVGYYPGSIYGTSSGGVFTPGPLATQANQIVYGGETVGGYAWVGSTLVPVWPMMGSGYPGDYPTVA